MPATSSPTVKRRRLAAELHACREQADLTIDDVAQELEWSAAKISRIENARVRVLPRDVKHLLRTYGVQEGAPEWELMITLARESHQKGWWHAYGDTLGESFRTYVGLEAAAATLRTYESECVPGLLQTEDYARAIIGAAAVPRNRRGHRKVRRRADGSPSHGWRGTSRRNCGRSSTKPGSGGWSVARPSCGPNSDRLLEASHLPNVTRPGHAVQRWRSRRYGRSLHDPRLCRAVRSGSPIRQLQLREPLPGRPAGIETVRVDLQPSPRGGTFH